MRIGDRINFGNYKWRVLDIHDNAALIITEYIIEQRGYHDSYTNITWADCAMRKYLNEEFYDKFTENDKTRIIPVLNKNPDNEWYHTEGGADTKDRIFLLSTEETVCHYFGDSSSKLYGPGKKQRYWFERKDENNGKRTTGFPDVCNGTWWWWLRSPGRVGVKAVYVHGDGNIGIQGNNILKGNVGGPFHNGDSQGGVRPALWLRMGEE